MPVADVKTLLKELAVRVGRGVILPRSRSRIVVLCYHSVSPSVPFTSASPRLFEQHLQWLREHCDIVGLRDAVCRAADRATCGRPVVAVTFDDGYADNYEFAFPLLRKYGMSATFFLTVGFVERNPAVMKRFQGLRQARPEDIHPLEWPQVRNMHQAGMEIGGHTYSHPNLARLDRASVEAEVRRSKVVIEERLGVEIASMAYPFGKPGCHFTPETMEIVSKVGYGRAAAVTCRPVDASHSRFALPRFIVTQDSISRLREKILGAWDLVGLWQEKAPMALRHAVESYDFSVS